MKKQLGKRVVSWLLAVGMMLSPTGAGITAVPAFAEESSIVDTAEESTIPADENSDSEGTDVNTDTENTDVNSSEGSEESTAEITDEEDTSSNGDSNETPSLDYINSIPVTINEKISAYYNTDGTNTVDLRTGNFVAVGNSISIGLSLNDYINHKVTINGEEIPLYLNDDGFVVFAQYTVENVESLNIDLVEAPWSEERLSQYVTLDVGEGVYVWYYNDYYQNTPDYAANGDYLAKGRYYYIDYYYTMFDEGAVLKINGTEVECEINEEYQLAGCYYYLPEDADFDTLRVEVVTDNGDIPVTYGEKISVVCYPPNSEDESEKQFPSSGSTVSSESSLYIATDISDAVDHIITINGNEISLDEWTPSGDGYYLGYGYTIQETDTEIAIELIEKEWTDEYKSQYSVFEISSGLYVYYYNEYLEVIGREAQNGDYIHKDAKFSVRYFNGSLPEGHTITINGEEVEYTINNDGAVQIWGYEVPDDSDVIKIVLTPPGDIPLSFDEEAITLYYNANTDYNTFYEDGDKVEAGTSIDINVNINDYINHKLMLNGEEIPLELSGNGTYFYGNYIVSEEDTQLEFVLEESQWTEEKLSDFAVVEIDDYIQLYNYNEYYQSAITNYPLENGDYIYKGQKIVVRVPYLYYPDKAIIRINGKQMDCSVSYYSDWQIWAYEPYYTDNTLSVRFDNEFSAPVTGFTEMFVNSFYSLEEALDYYENMNAAITIYVNEPVAVSTLNLPKKAQKLTIDGVGTIKYSGKTLNIPCDTTIGCELITSAAVKVASGKTLTLEGAAKTLGAVSGAATSKLVAKADVTASGLTSFGEVTVADGKTLTVSGAVKGVTSLNGAIKLTNANTTAAITNIGAAEIILVETDGKLPKTTVTNVNEALAVTVKNKTGYLASGTTILYTTKENYANKITIKNTAEDGDTLTAYHYPKTKSIKAEVGTALTLTYDDFEKSYPNFELLFADITDPTVDYTIKVNTYLELDAKFALPKSAKSITFVTDNESGFGFTGTKLTVPYDVTIGEDVYIEVCNKKGTIDIAVGKDATLTNNGYINGIGKLSGTKTSNLVGEFYVENLATFDNVQADVDVWCGKVTGVNVLDGELGIYGAKSTAAIKTATVNSKIVLYKENGILPKVTLEGIGEAIEDDTTIDVVVFENLYINEADLESGTAILYTKKENFADKINIQNNNGEMKAYCYGKTIKAEYPGAVIVSTDETTTDDDKDYPNFELAIAEIDAAKNSNADYVITIKKDIAPAKFALPKYAASVTLTSEDGATINVGKATAITANTDLAIDNVAFVTTGKSLTITAKKNLTVDGLYGNVTAVKGGAKSVLNWNGESADTAKADITGFGTVNVAEQLTTGKNFNVTKLVLENNAKLVVSAATTKSSIKALDASNNCAISYEEGAKALTFTGKDTDFVLSGGKLTIAGEVANGQAVLTTKNVSTTKLENGIVPANKDVEYGFVQMGNSICYMGEVLEVTIDREITSYATWNEVVAAIETANDNEVNYIITLLDDYNANGAIKFPKAGTYKSITIISAQDEEVDGNEMFDFNFTGNLALTSTTTFTKVNIGAIKNGEPAKYTINAGKNTLSIFDVDTSMLTSISSSAWVGISNANAEKIKAGDLSIGGAVNAIGGITAKNMKIIDNTSLVMNQGSKLAITGNVEANSESSKLTVTILDKNGNVAALKKGYVVATIKGDYVAGSIVLDEAHTGFALEFINGKLVVV